MRVYSTTLIDAMIRIQYRQADCKYVQIGTDSQDVIACQAAKDGSLLFHRRKSSASLAASHNDEQSAYCVRSDYSTSADFLVSGFQPTCK